MPIAELTRLISVRSLGHMLAASSSLPNSQTPANAPRPAIWHGVTDGLACARQAITVGDLQRAEQILLELVEFAPAEIRGWKLLARTQRELGHIKEGITSARRALALQEKTPNHDTPASLTLAQLLWQQHEHEQARAMLELLIEQQPDDTRLAELKQQWDAEERE